MNTANRVETNLERWSKTSAWAQRVAIHKLRVYLDGQRIPELIRRTVTAGRRRA